MRNPCEFAPSKMRAKIKKIIKKLERQGAKVVQLKLIKRGK